MAASTRRRGGPHLALSQFTALAAGAVLFGLGAREARRLARGDIAAARRSARQIGLTRIAFGLAMLLRPTLLITALGIRDVGRPPARWLPRLLAAREIALGAGLATSSRGDGNPYPGLITLSLTDAGEAVVLLLALHTREVACERGWAFIAADVGSALTGVGAMVQLRNTPSSAGKKRR
jgi:hypothetical protein